MHCWWRRFPLGRIVLVSRIDERVRLARGDVGWLSRLDNPSNVTTHFQLVGGLPVWTYELEGTTIVKRSCRGCRTRCW